MTVIAVLLVTVSFVDAQSARSLYSRGEDALAESRYSSSEEALFDAIEYFQRALSINPSYREALVGLAEAYYGLQEYPTALRYALGARELGSDAPQLQNLEARIRLARGEIETARELYREVLAREPNNLEARLGTAQLALAEGNPEEATRELERLLRRAPENRRALLALTLIYRDRGNREAARRYLRQALRFHSENPRVQLVAAEQARVEGNLEEARFHAETALTLRPSFTEARIVLAELLLAEGDAYGAETQLRQALGDTVTGPRVWYTLGRVLEEQGKLDEAIRALRRGMEIAPEEERLTLALESVAEALPLEDDRRTPIAEEYLERGNALVARNLLSRAEVSFRTGLRLDPYSRDLRLALAEIYDLRGYRARYLQELRVLREQGHNDQYITDRIESYESLLADSVANSWEVDQFTVDRAGYSLYIGYRDSRGSGEWYGNDHLYAQKLRDFLLRDERLDVAGELRPVEDHPELLRHARARGDSFSLLLRFNETGRSLTVEATLYLTRTGRLVTSLSSLRGGNNRVQNGISQASDAVRRTMPRRGTLIRRSFDRGLIDLGSASGVAAEQEFRIVREGAATLTAEEPGVLFTAENVVGTFTVTRVDDLLAEGNVEPASVIDEIRVGDRVFILPEEFEPAESSQTVRSPLFESIESLR